MPTIPRVSPANAVLQAILEMLVEAPPPTANPMVMDHSPRALQIHSLTIASGATRTAPEDAQRVAASASQM